MPSRFKNPMRLSIKHLSVDFSVFDVNVTELEIRTGEGNLYVHWEPPVCDACLRLADEMHNWEREGAGLMWTCPEHTPERADAEVYTNY